MTDLAYREHIDGAQTADVRLALDDMGNPGAPRILIANDYRFFSRTIHILRPLARKFNFVYRQPADLVWCFYPDDASSAFRAAVASKCPVLLECRGLWKPQKRAQVANAFERAARIVALTESLKREIVMTVGGIDQSKIHIIPHGSSLTDTAFANPSGGNIGTLTNLAFPEKAMGVVSIAHALRESGFRGRFLVGSGPGEYVPTHPGQLGPGAEYIGTVEDRLAFFSSIGVFVYWSDYDGQPGVVMEAQHAGMPMVVGGGVRTGIHDDWYSGRVAKSAYDLAWRAMDVLQSPGAAIEAARERAARMRALFAWDDLAEQRGKVIRSLGC